MIASVLICRNRKASSSSFKTHQQAHSMIATGSTTKAMTMRCGLLLLHNEWWSSESDFLTLLLVLLLLLVSDHKLLAMIGVMMMMTTRSCFHWWWKCCCCCYWSRSFSSFFTIRTDPHRNALGRPICTRFRASQFWPNRKCTTVLQRIFSLHYKAHRPTLLAVRE